MRYSNLRPLTSRLYLWSLTLRQRRSCYPLLFGSRLTLRQKRSYLSTSFWKCCCCFHRTAGLVTNPKRTPKINIALFFHEGNVGCNVIAYFCNGQLENHSRIYQILAFPSVHMSIVVFKHQLHELVQQVS